MDKVKVSKEVFEALQHAEGFLNGDLKSVVIDIVGGYKFTARENKPLNNIGKDLILKIYKYGYELEETPEEKLVKKYKACLVEGVADVVFLERAIGIVECLSTLGIKIKGINE